MSHQIPVLTLSGTPYERGLAHGRAFKDAIHDFAESVVAVHQANNSQLKSTRSDLHNFCLRHLGFMQKYSKDLFTEMEGIAEGADISFDDILLLNSFLELEDIRVPGLGARFVADKLWGCTSFNLPDTATADNKPYIGQTYDMEKYYEKYLALLRIPTPGGGTSLVVTMTGILGLNGLNSHGIAAVINKIVAPDARPGVIYPFIMREILATERIGDALGKAIFSPRASGLNYQFCGEGVNFCAETSAERYQLLDCSRGLAHTNHYVGSEMKQLETPNWLSHGGSMVRKQVADNFLAKHHGSITPELLKDLTRDHTNAPRSICAHGFPEEGELTAFHTILGLVMSPEEGWLELCAGNPCENEYVRYEL